MIAPYVSGFPYMYGLPDKYACKNANPPFLSSPPSLPNTTTDAFIPAFVSLIDSGQRI